MIPKLPIKFHQNPLTGLGGIALTRNVDRGKDGRAGQTDTQGDSYIPPTNFVGGGVYKNKYVC